MSSEASRTTEQLSGHLYGAASWLLVGLGLVGLVAITLRHVGGSAPIILSISAVVVAVSVGCLTAGVFLNPRFQFWRS